MSRPVRVGLLVVAGIVLFLAAIFAIASRSFLFSDTFLLESQFENVAGLQPGAAVQYQGVHVGRVETVQLPRRTDGKILVTMAIKEEAQHLIHERTQAQIKTSGLIGSQIVVLVNPPGPLAEQAEAGDTIPGVEPFNLFEITDRALAAVDTFARVAVEAQQIMEDIQQGEGSLGKFIYDPTLYNSLVATANESERTLEAIGRDAKAIVELAEQSTESVQQILRKINEGDGTLAQLLNDPGVYNSLLATADTLQSVAADIRAITSSAENATNWAALGAYRFAENMEALKHNFLFKRYFEERGYYDKAPFELREQAIRETYEDLQARLQELYRLQQQLEAQQAALEHAAARAPAPDSTNTSARAVDGEQPAPDSTIVPDARR